MCHWSEGSGTAFVFCTTLLWDFLSSLLLGCFLSIDSEELLYVSISKEKQNLAHLLKSPLGFLNQCCLSFPDLASFCAIVCVWLGTALLLLMLLQHSKYYWPYMLRSPIRLPKWNVLRICLSLLFSRLFRRNHIFRLFIITARTWNFICKVKQRNSKTSRTNVLFKETLCHEW